MQEKLRKFMIGRYGGDQLGRFLLGVTVVIMVLSIAFRNPIFEILALLILILSNYRMFSKDINRRYAENQQYLGYKARFWGYFGKLNSRREQKKTHHIYSCPTCKQKIRVPKGKGKICITCPKCRAEFIRKS